MQFQNCTGSLTAWKMPAGVCAPAGRICVFTNVRKLFYVVWTILRRAIRYVAAK